MKAWRLQFRTLVFVRLLIPFLLGLLLAYVLQFDFSFQYLKAIVITCLLAILLLLLIKPNYIHRYSTGVLVYSSFLLLGFILMSNTLANSKVDDFKPKKALFVVKLINKGDVKPNTVLYHARILQHSQKQLQRQKIVFSIYKSDSTQLAIGDELVVNQYVNEIPPPTNPHQFSYKNYLARKQIFFQTYIAPKHLLAIQLAHQQPNVIQRLRAFAITYIQNYVKPNQQAVARALLLGDKSKLDEVTEEQFSRSGTMHILAVSGLHVGMITILLFGLIGSIRKVIPFPKIVELLFIIAGIWLFALITGARPSVLRAAAMFSLLAIGRYQFPYTNSINILAAIALFMLIIKPLYLLDVGFQMSFSAVLGILLVLPLFQMFKTSSTFANYFIDITLISIVAQLATMPFVLFYFHQFPLLGVFANLIAVPLAFAIVAVGFCSFLFAKIPFVNELLGQILSWLLQLLKFNNQWFSEFTFSVANQLYLPVISAVLLGLSILFLFLYFAYQQKKLLFVTLTTFLAFVTSYSMFSIAKLNQHQIIAYDVNDNIVLDEIVGKRSILHSLTEIDSLTYKYAIQPNHLAKAIKKIEKIELKPNQLLHLNGQLLQPITDSTEFVTRNAVLLMNEPKYKWLQTNSTLTNPVFITGIYQPQTIHFSKNYHFLKQEGAYQFQIDK